MNKLLIALMLFCTLGCTSQKSTPSLSYAEKMADTEMKLSPESWMLDFSKAPKWNYCHGLVLQSIWKVGEATGEQKYFDYVISYTDTMIGENGSILTYKLDKYNIDHVNPGKMLFQVYEKTKEPRIKMAIDTLREQMRTQPRTSDNGFWHKKVYPYQMWLDGLYMGSPFLAQYGATFNEPELFDEVVHQITTVAKHTYDPKTGLYYHGWDEKREQAWADPETGLSPNFWSRSIGWYMMAMVDVLDFLPENHPGRPEVIRILQNLSASIEKFQDPKEGLWYQVTDKIGDEGNYMESSSSAMFIYTWAKGAQKGYLNENYLHKAQAAYDQFLKNFVTVNDDGTLRVSNCCAVAGLGGNPYRSGSYEYYVNELVRDNDPKTTGPFIMASLLLNK